MIFKQTLFGNTCFHSIWWSKVEIVIFRTEDTCVQRDNAGCYTLNVNYKLSFSGKLTCLCYII